MGRILRSDIFRKDEVGYYLLTNRCVLQAFLCGYDATSGVSYEHRKHWLKNLLTRFSMCFSIEIGAYNIMCNHFHLVVKNRPDLSIKLNDDEVIFRWWNIIRADSTDSNLYPCPDEKRKEWLAKPNYLMTLRERLSDISWLMGRISQLMARAANKESGTSGRFWQGRFDCKRLLDENAVLAGMAYTDLNKVRAGMTETAETSEYCSLNDRVYSSYENQTRSIILAPLDRKNEGAFLNIDLTEYKEFVYEKQNQDKDRKSQLVQLFRRAAHSVGTKIKLEIQKKLLGLKQIKYGNLISEILESSVLPIPINTY